ncbi:hypothetical protein DJ93_4937 [Bacillus clarus]|uniref:Uncharacterized protein n=1 Tax=Bacillus clarus TaxID=2338372 RepID=A0A090Z9Z5_9BACI|nr:hypothetical protein DJ93_4937 [Bacillus clarus]
MDCNHCGNENETENTHTNTTPNFSKYMSVMHKNEISEEMHKDFSEQPTDKI